MPTVFPTEYDDWPHVYDNIDDIEAYRINRVQEAIVELETKIGTGSYSTNMHTLVYNFITTGRAMWFGTDAAPTGWTIDSTPSDRVLAVKGGSDGYDAAGGTVSGTSWTSLKNHTHGLNSHDHTVPSSHNHRWNRNGGASAHDQCYNVSGSLTNYVPWSWGKYYPAHTMERRMGEGLDPKDPEIHGLEDAYTELITENPDTDNGPSGYSSISDMRPVALLGIIAKKD